MKLHPVVIRNVVTVVVECNNGGIRFGVVNFDATVTVKYTQTCLEKITSLTKLSA
jgi:hypothetical protein